jgi:hypothetical protein
MKWIQTRTTNPSYPMRHNYRRHNGTAIDYGQSAYTLANLTAGAVAGSLLFSRISRPLVGMLPVGILQTIGTAAFGYGLLLAGSWAAEEYQGALPQEVNIRQMVSGAAVGYGVAAVSALVPAVATGAAGYITALVPNMSGYVAGNLGAMDGYVAGDMGLGAMNGYIPGNGSMHREIAGPDMDMSGYGETSYPGEPGY